MGRFEFRSRDIELDFGGVKTTISGSVDLAKRIEEIGKEMVEHSKNVKTTEDIDRETKYMLGILDELLGEETMDAIEAERNLDFYDCIDMFRYITEEVHAYHSVKVPMNEECVPQGVQPMAMVAENRATRRAKRRK